MGYNMPHRNVTLSWMSIILKVVISVSMLNTYLRNIPFAVMPIEILLYWQSYPWPLGTVGCTAYTILAELVTYVSILTMIAFTFERYA